MAQERTLAPWAELVPDTGPMTADELFEMPDDDRWLYELVEGRLVRMPPPGGAHGRIAGHLFAGVYNWVTPRSLGTVLIAEAGFRLAPGTVLAPDVAYVRADRLPVRGDREDKRYWQIAPDLVAEVASPRQKRDDLEAKVVAWIGAGVHLVWVVWPDTERVDVWRPDAQGAAQLAATLAPGEALNGMDALPGFIYPVDELFG